MGKVMKAVMPKLAGKNADGKAVNEAVRRKLGGLSLTPPSSTPTLARSAASAGAATMTSRVLGLVRDQVLAYYFGAGDAMDAYHVAFRIPNLFRDLFAEGAMSAAFVPDVHAPSDRRRARSPRGGSATCDQRADRRHRRARRARHRLRRAAGHRARRRSTRAVPAKLELTVTLDADHAAVADAHRASPRR